MFRSAMTAATLLAATVLGHATSASAAACTSHYAQTGIPLVTGVTYKSWDSFSLKPATALNNVARAIMAEGFSDVTVQQEYGTVTAVQETSGSGRPQTLQVVVRQSGKGSRVDATFTVQPGQSAPNMRANICRIIAGAGGV
nr:hypothetical protein [Rhizobium halophytocola]